MDRGYVSIHIQGFYNTAHGILGEREESVNRDRVIL